MSPRARLLTGFLLANIAIAAAATLVLLNRPDAPPQIQGVLLPQPRPIPDFQLLDHSGQSFTQDNLLGQWHLVSYGFTTCPDICPTTLSQLVSVNRELESQGHSDLRVLFLLRRPQARHRTSNGRLHAIFPLGLYRPYTP